MDKIQVALTAVDEITVKGEFSKDSAGTLLLQSITIEGPNITADSFRSVSFKALKESALSSIARVEKPEELTRKGKTPEEFSQLVAEWYKWACNNSATPTAHLAEYLGVNVNNVGAWIYQARLRGYLPPARPRPHKSRTE